MPQVKFPYGKEHLTLDIPESRFNGTLVSDIHHYVPEKSEIELVRDAMAAPVGSAPLSELAKGKNKVVIIASDHTRPVPSKVIAPLMLEEIRKGNPDADITFLIATGFHRPTTREELVGKFGEEIVANEKIYVHESGDESMLVEVGTLPSGGRLIVNRLAAEADLLVAEGFIEPHFFAGFSGGRKSVLPGVASSETVLYNHNAGFIANPNSRTGILEGNPIHEDMLYAAKAAKLAFICNVVLDADKKVIHAVAGDVDKAHRAGVDFLCGQCRVNSVPSDIVITTNGGYPLDQNVYQAVKGMTAAEATVKEGGVIIMAASCSDGHGGHVFYETFRDHPDLQELMNEFLATPAAKTIPDQWQSQIFTRIMLKAKVILISEISDEMARDFHTIPAHSLEEALAIADKLLAEQGVQDGKILAIPDGVSVVVI